MNSLFNFKVLSKDKETKARVGKLVTPHGIVETPVFVPVGTQATVKSLTPQDLKEIGVQILFGNTYHLHLRPGEEMVKKFGGLGKFMGWDVVTMTDSGGFQVFSLGKNKGRLPHVSDDAHKISHEYSKLNRSLSENRLYNQSSLRVNSGSIFSSSENGQPSQNNEPKLVKITEDGVEFRSHLDGSKHIFTPEESIKIQKKLGADIILAFDECAPHPSTYKYTKEAMARTHSWAIRCLKEAKGSQALFGIVQGGIYKDLREESAKFISSLPFGGIAIGGVSVGESKKEMRDVLDWVVPHLPENKIRHLLGIGEIDDIFDSVEGGMDSFDCVTPTRMGRMGFVFVSPHQGNVKNKFRIDIAKSKFARSKDPLDSNCSCYVCQNFTRGYINHLFRSRELLAYRLATYHNVYFVINLVKNIRESVIKGNFIKLKKQWLGN